MPASPDSHEEPRHPITRVPLTILTEDETKWIAANQDRCQHCGHLLILHPHSPDFYEDVSICAVGNCDCIDFAAPAPPRAMVRKGPPAFEKPSPDLVLHLKGEDVHCEWDKERGTYVEKPQP